MVDLKSTIRDVQDFPKKGIVFKDITTLINDGEAFREVIDEFYKRCKGKEIDAVVSIESRGFIFGAALAYKLGAAVIPVRKKGKLPHETFNASYELEYGTDTLEVHRDAFKAGEKVLIVDDLLATGGTIKAVIDLVKKLKGEIVEIFFLIELEFLKGRDKLKGYPVFSLIKYDKE
ncbi:MAG: adenine phosphoribosyltransferase [Candidatus Omnitrophica bacterium]|nr:adenine phosphoribosyltransferase [Candidatus Omnitrophota bacterium]